MRKSLQVARVLSFCLMVLVCLAPVVSAQSGETTITATATVKTAAGASATAPVTITIKRFSTDAERNELIAAIKSGGTAAARDLLAKREAIGTLALGPKSTPIKFAFARAMGADRLITAATSEPVLFLGAGTSEAKPKAGYDVALILLQVPASGTGTGELSPAAKIKVDEQGAVVTEDYGAEVVRLTNIAGK